MEEDAVAFEGTGGVGRGSDDLNATRRGGSERFVSLREDPENLSK